MHNLTIIKLMQSKVSLDRVHFLTYYSIESLESFVRSGFAYLFNSLLSSNDRLISLRYYSDELLWLADFLAKVYFLIKHKATYAEYFYGVSREAVASPIKSALFLALYPFMKKKLQNYYTKLKVERPYQALSPLEKVVFNMAPLLNLVLDFVQLVFRFRYLISRKAAYYSLAYFVLKARLAYSQQQEQGSALDLFNRPVLLLIFIAYKILSWWYSPRQQSQSNNNVGSRQVQPPFNQAQLNRAGMCPLCSKKFSNPAAITTSGYVFCLTCISPFIKGHKKCPLTGIPTTEEEIRVLYA